MHLRADLWFAWRRANERTSAATSTVFVCVLNERCIQWKSIAENAISNVLAPLQAACACHWSRRRLQTKSPQRILAKNLEQKRLLIFNTPRALRARVYVSPIKSNANMYLATARTHICTTHARSTKRFAAARYMAANDADSGDGFTPHAPKAVNE